MSNAAATYVSKGPPRFICGPTCGCGKWMDMVLTENVLPPAWTLPPTCPHCGQSNPANVFVNAAPSVSSSAPPNRLGTCPHGTSYKRDCEDCGRIVPPSSSAEPAPPTPWKKKDRSWSDYPLGTYAKDHTGSSWMRVERGWLASGGDVFPTPAASAWLVRVPSLSPVQEEAPPTTLIEDALAVDTLARNVAEYPNLIPELIEKTARLFDRVERQPSELHRIGDLLEMARADVNVENVGMAVGALRFAWEEARRELAVAEAKLASRSVTRCQKCGAEALPSPTHALDLEAERDDARADVERLTREKAQLAMQLEAAKQLGEAPTNG